MQAMGHEVSHVSENVFIDERSTYKLKVSILRLFFEVM